MASVYNKHSSTTALTTTTPTLSFGEMAISTVNGTTGAQPVIAFGNGVGNTILANQNQGVNNAIVTTDASGNITPNSDTSITANSCTFSNSGLNNVYTFAIGGLNQTNNSSTVATILNITSPSNASVVSLKLNGGVSNTAFAIETVYNGGLATVGSVIKSNNVLVATFNGTNVVTFAGRINVPTLNATTNFLLNSTVFTASGTISTPIAIGNSATAITLTLPASPITGDVKTIVNINTGMLTINPAAGNIGSSTTLRLRINQSATLVFSTSWRVIIADSNENQSNNITTVTATSTIVYPTTFVNAAGATTQTLPAATAVPLNTRYTVKRLGGAGTVTINSGGGTINGVASTTLAATYASLDFISDGTNWFTI